MDGISLTVNAVLSDRFTVQLIPETQSAPPCAPGRGRR
nr:hypothetical protein [Stigmatella aurantiaca]